MNTNMQKKCVLSLIPVRFLLGFIWILACLVSHCPILVKAVGGDEPDVDLDVVKPVIKVCSESALKLAMKHHDFIHENAVGDGGGVGVKYLWKVPSDWVSTNETTEFTVINEEPKCRGSANHQTLNRSDDAERRNDTLTAHFYPNGYFRIDRNIYAPEEYCIESFTKLSSLEFRSINIKLCKPDCGVGKRRPCIKKCCPLDEIFAAPKKASCTSPPKGSVPFMPTFYDDIDTKSKTESAALMPHFIFNHPKMFRENCKEKFVIPLPSSKISADILLEKSKDKDSVLHSSQFRIRTDGAIMYKSLENKCDTMSVSLDTFCIDGVADPEGVFNNTEDEYIIFQCQVVEKDAYLDKYLSFTFGVLLLTTSLFPLVTSVVYTLLWKKQNVHGWTIAATSGSLFFMYIFQGTAHLIGVTLKEKALNTFYCRLLGILVHFFMMSTFTWCSVMTFDLFITFRSVVPMNQRLQGFSRYMKYSAFGWGVPTITVLIGILMDFVIYNSNDCSYHAVPAYGQQSCWLVESSLGEYLYYPAGFLLCVNMSLFTATCVKLCMYGRGASVRARKNNDAFGECFSRFSKLFCVMGISWIFEILSWYVDGLGFVWYWNIIDIFNILRAVAVFAIYVCKNDIIKQLDDSYPSLQRIYRPFGTLFGRKCSGDMNTESTVLSAAPNSPGAALKMMNTSCTVSGAGGGRSKGNDGATSDL